MKFRNLLIITTLITGLIISCQGKKDEEDSTEQAGQMAGSMAGSTAGSMQGGLPVQIMDFEMIDLDGGLDAGIEVDAQID